MNIDVLIMMAAIVHTLPLHFFLYLNILNPGYGQHECFLLLSVMSVKSQLAGSVWFRELMGCLSLSSELKTLLPVPMNHEIPLPTCLSVGETTRTQNRIYINTQSSSFAAIPSLTQIFATPTSTLTTSCIHFRFPSTPTVQHMHHHGVGDGVVWCTRVVPSVPPGGVGYKKPAGARPFICHQLHAPSIPRVELLYYVVAAS